MYSEHHESPQLFEALFYLHNIPVVVNMFQLPSFKLPFFNSHGGSYPSIDLPSVEIHDVETAAEKRPRTLKHLLKANHANHSIIYHDLRFHNHTPHVRTVNASLTVATNPELRS
jgi:hypothetical protein